MRKALNLPFLAEVFMSPRDDHPARKEKFRRGRGLGKQVSGNSKWHRRMLDSGRKIVFVNYTEAV